MLLYILLSGVLAVLISYGTRLLTGPEAPARRPVLETTRRSKRHDVSHFVVGIDFGTTYSGVSYCFSLTPDLKEIRDVGRWPSRQSNECQPKAPSIIKYERDKEKTRTLWGYEAEASRRPGDMCSWMKLHLDEDHLENTIAHYGANDATEMLRSSLPADKSAEDVVSEYLRFLHNQFIAEFAREFPEYLDKPRRYVLTVPAIWTAKAKERTLRAAKNAGIGVRKDDQIELIGEPEAAAIYCIHDRYGIGNLKVGDTFLLCDAGGGTCDLVTYKIIEVKPKLKFEEVVRGTGGLCGSISINRAFKRELHRRIGPSFEDPNIWLPKYTDSNSRLMTEFVRKKESFGSSFLDDDGCEFELPVELDIEPNESNGINKYKEITFTKEEMENLFNPTVEDIKRLVEGQVQDARGKGSRVTKIFLVGGFGASKYLLDKLREWGRRRSPAIEIIQPSQSWPAVMRGAVWSAFSEGSLSRRLRYNYGVDLMVAYNEENPLHKGLPIEYNPLWGRRVRTISWFAHVDEKVEEGSVKTIAAFFRIDPNVPANERMATVRLFASPHKKPPINPKDPGVTEFASVLASLSSVPTSELTRHNGILSLLNPRFKVYYQGGVDLEMTFHSAEVLRFEIMYKRRVLHESKVNYERQVVL